MQYTIQGTTSRLCAGELSFGHILLKCGDRVWLLRELRHLLCVGSCLNLEANPNAVAAEWGELHQ